MELFFLKSIEAEEKLIFLLINWETKSIAKYQIECEKLEKKSWKVELLITILMAMK